MDDAFFVCCLERLSNGSGDVERFFNWNRATLNPLR